MTGATGTTGSETVRALRALGVDVIAGVHSPDKSGPFRDLGATVKQFNFADVAGMTGAMAGADRLFLVTPPSPETEELIASIVAAAKAAGVAHIAKLSGLRVDYEGFAFGRWRRPAERLIAASGMSWTFLRPNFFMQNFFGYTRCLPVGDRSAGCAPRPA